MVGLEFKARLLCQFVSLLPHGPGPRPWCTVRFTAGGNLPDPVRYWQCQETFLMPGLGGAEESKDAIGTSHVETEDAGQNPSVHPAAPHGSDFSLCRHQQ